MLRIIAFLVLFSALPAGAQPNIVLIVADDLGYGDLSGFGASDLQTPHIDQIVSGGMRFTQFYANSPVCSPTRAALLSGRYPTLAGVPGVIRTRASDSWGHLSEDLILLPEMLRRQGYHTGMVGKWHLGLRSPNTPLDRGFDFFHGFLGDMMDDYYHHRRHGINYMRLNRSVIDPEGHATDLFATWAVDYIKDRSESDAPFFLYLAFNAPHTPVQPPEAWVQRVREREPEMEASRTALVALIEHMDHAVGQVILALETLGLSESTLFVFVSDNGGQLSVGANNGALRAGKGTVYEGGIRVPAAIRWPGKVEAGIECNSTLLTMDLFPTLIESAGGRVLHKTDGTSFLSILNGASDKLPERDLFFSRREGNPRFGGKTIEAVLSGDWKLLQNSPFGPLELYNLRDDPLETRDLSGQEPEKMNELGFKLREYIRISGSVPWQPESMAR